MKVLFVSSDRNIFKKDSDIQSRYLDYGKLFEEIHVIVFSDKKLGNKNVKIGDNVFVYPTNHIFKLFYLWNIYKIAKKIILLLGIGNSPLVISSQDPFEAGLAAWMLKKIYKIPLQIQIHTDFLSPYFGKGSFINKFRVILAKFLIPRADGIRVVSERIKNSLVASACLPVGRANSLVPITVLPIFIDTELIKAAPIRVDLHKKYPQFNFIILMVSRLTREKNVGLAIKAMAELVKKHPKLGLVIVGSGPELKKLKFLTSKLQLDESIKFENWTNDPSSYYKTADLFLLTSNYEGYGRTVIEAMVAGLPVVISDVGLVGEIVINDKNGVVVPVGDSKAVVDGVSSLIGDRAKRDRFLENTRKTFKMLIKKPEYLELYKKYTESCIINH